MPNKNRQTGEYSAVVKPETKAKEEKAKQLFAAGKKHDEIAVEIGVSVARIREYLRVV